MMYGVVGDRSPGNNLTPFKTFEGNQLSPFREINFESELDAKTSPDKHLDLVEYLTEVRTVLAMMKKEIVGERKKREVSDTLVT
jgi:hypothetical protein